MATNKQRRLFEEIGLLDEEVQANPYQVLGLSQDFATEMLAEDPSGETLRSITGALHKALARQYHPDVGKTADPERFRGITEADQRIAGASISSLSRWAKENRHASSSSTQVNKLREDNEKFVTKATDVLQNSLEYGSHPLHFSRLEDSQGVLLKRQRSSLLLRQDEVGVTVRGGQVANLDSLKATTHETQAFDFRGFLSKHQSFGIAPDTPIVGYIDETGRASILSSELVFMMDVTDPVNDRRMQREKLSATEKTMNDGTDQWLRTKDPVVIITKTPNAVATKRPEAQIITFPNLLSAQGSRRELTWDLSMEVVGSVADKKFFSQMRSNTDLGAIALAGSEKQKTLSYFNMIATQARHLIEQAPGYTPLIQHGNSLMLFDKSNHLPVITDASILGVMGSDSRSA